jgi:hypothetical protein
MKYSLENGNGVNSIRKNKFKSSKKIARGDEALGKRKFIDVGFGKILIYAGGMKR